jgi:hypothetical protein
MINVTNADFTRKIVVDICDAVKKYNALEGINHGIIDILDWDDKNGNVTIQITEGNKSAVTTDTFQAIYFAIKLLLCTATLMCQAINVPNVAEIED